MKLGDKVYLKIESEFNDGDNQHNPINMIGEIIRCSKGDIHFLPITLKWESGIQNSYNLKDLSPLSEV